MEGHGPRRRKPFMETVKDWVSGAIFLALYFYC